MSKRFAPNTIGARGRVTAIRMTRTLQPAASKGVSPDDRGAVSRKLRGEREISLLQGSLPVGIIHRQRSTNRTAIAEGCRRSLPGFHSPAFPLPAYQSGDPAM